MTASELVKVCGLKEICLPSPDKEIVGIYIGDLLSWVMGNANEKNAWITIMTNINTVAVATLVDVGCIILADGVAPSNDTLDAAKEKGVNILSSDKPAYETAIKLHGVGI